MLIPWILVVVCAFVMWRWCRDYASGRAIPLVLLWDAAALVGFFAWGRAARDVWTTWDYQVTIVLWFVVGVGSILWTMLAISLVERDPPSSGSTAQPHNYVSAHTTTRQRYQWRGQRATKRKGKRR